MSGITVRNARSADLPAIAALERECYSDPWPASAFASLPENPQVYFGVAMTSHDHQIAGYVIGWYVMDEAELANLAVARACRGRGIGQALLDSMLDDAARRDASDIYLEVRESNRAARSLYASRGFEEVGRRKTYYRSPDEDALILRRTLKP